MGEAEATRRRAMRTLNLTALVVILTATMLTVAWGNVNLPKGLEGILPIYPGSKVVSAVERNGNSQTTMETEDESTAVMVFYRKAMAYKGWNIISGMILKGGSSITFSKGVQTLRITTQYSDEDSTTILVSIFK